MRLLRSAPFVLAAVASCTTPRNDEPTAKTAAAIGWAGGAVSPIRIRSGHTSTLLGTGDVLVAGGGETPRSSEIVQPYAGTVVAGPELVVARKSHTATMLLSGKVLLAGGADTATAELFDPVTRTSVATGSMTKVRAGHVAIRLRSGRVLVVGGADDTSTEIYDPPAGVWTAGPSRTGKSAQALATLEDGRVVLAGSSPTTEIYDANVEFGAWSVPGPGLPGAVGVQTLTRLGDGRIFSGWSKGCVSNGTSETCESVTSILDKKAITAVPGPPFVAGRDGFTATRTVGGEVLFIGGFPVNVRRVELFDPAMPAALANDGNALAAHVDATSTLLPGGDVLVIGGAQAALDRRTEPGRWATASFTLMHGREKHASARLHDGTVLVVGGENVTYSPTGEETKLPVAEAEVLDLAGGKTTAAGTLASAHLYGTATTLRSGKVLVAGGGTADVELYTAGSGFVAAAPMASARTYHSATLLPSGKVLVIGGTAEPSAEMFDPEAGTWSSLPKPETAFAKGHGAVVLPNGLVLVIGRGAAEIFDPGTNTFRRTTPPGASREGQTARLLPSGMVFVAGGGTLAAEVFDPATERWSFTAVQTDEALERVWTPRPDGRLVVSGGHQPIEGVRASKMIFDPIAHPTGTFLDLPTTAHVGYDHAATLAGTGEVVDTGGQSCFFLCRVNSLATISVYGDDAVARPTITEAPATVVAGSSVRIDGTGFANGPEASDGTRRSSAVNHPVAVWVSDLGDAVVPSTIADFTDTSATWIVPTTALYGHGQLFIAVAGAFGHGRSVTITPALPATVCANDAQCGTGFCTDGVCCDRRCDGNCEGCSKARKKTGEDGVCGAVPAGQDITGRCVLPLGTACSAASECGTGFCASGVCCDSTCEGQCLSCNHPGKAGRCSAINEGACGAACDGDHTLKQVGVPDVDCAPYKCDGPQCNQTCASARDCVAPAVCDYEGHCVPGVAPEASTDDVCGCRAVGAARGTAPWWSLAIGALLLARRRRR